MTKNPASNQIHFKNKLEKQVKHLAQVNFDMWQEESEM